MEEQKKIQSILQEGSGTQISVHVSGILASCTRWKSMCFESTKVEGGNTDVAFLLVITL